MTVQGPSLLSPSTPTSSVSTEITIGHVQLRDLVICPHERGVVNYVQGNSIMEQNLSRSGSKRAIANLPFTPNTLSALRLPDSVTTLVAAGGQDAELHLSLHSSSSPSPAPTPLSHHRSSRPHWQYQTQLQGSINNSVMLTSLSPRVPNSKILEPSGSTSLSTTRLYPPMDGPSCQSATHLKCTSTIYPAPLASPSNQLRNIRLYHTHHQSSPTKSTLLSTHHLPFPPHFQRRIRPME